MASKRIGILGSGDVAQALGRGFAWHGWDVTLGTRDPGSLSDWLESTPGTLNAGSFAHAASHGEVAVLAVNGEHAERVLDLAGPDNFAGALVLDATNPLDFSGEGPPHLLFGGTDSLGERVQAALPDAAVVKCFNTVSNTQMVDPDFAEGTPSMLVCGDDAEAKARTEDILVELGWPGALDVGDITAARYLEALVPLWVRVGGILETQGHAFAVVE